MSEQEKSSNGPVAVHVDPPLRHHRDRQPATPFMRRDVRAGNVVDAGAGQGQDTQKIQGGWWQWAGTNNSGSVHRLKGHMMC